MTEITTPPTEGNVPQLRFPEFKDKGAWEEKRLGNIADFFKGKGISKSDIDAQGQVFCIRYGELYTIYNEVITEVISKTNISLSELFLSKKNDILIPSSGETKLDIAKASCLLVDDIALGGDLNILRTGENGVFLSYMLNGTYKLEIAKKAQGNTVVHLYSSQLKLLDISLPHPPEQQKIASCLSSIDELITAENQQLENLKIHKKGLMQSLFPAEGETVPKHRFPEFKDSGAWEEKQLNKLGELVSGLTYCPEDVRESGLLVLRSSNVQNGEITLEDNVYVKTDIKGANLSKPNDILICVRNGSKALIGKNAMIPEDMPLCTHGAFMTIFRSPIAKFIFQLFQSVAYQKQVDADLGATINSINGSQFLKYTFFVPSQKEQQKIASCLSSLDDLITAQSQKVEALKLHKKGLMQKLFPNSPPLEGWQAKPDGVVL